MNKPITIQEAEKRMRLEADRLIKEKAPLLSSLGIKGKDFKIKVKRTFVDGVNRLEYLFGVKAHEQSVKVWGV